LTLLNRAVGWLFDGLARPLAGMTVLAGLALVSLAVAVAMLLVVRRTSNQAAVGAAKRGIWAGLFEIRLFAEDPVAILRAERDVLRHNFAYVRHSFVPLLWMIVPLTLVMAQLQSLYAYRAIEPGESFLFEMKLAPDTSSASTPRPRITLRVPPGLRAETQEVWNPSSAELSWRLRAEQPGRYTVSAESERGVFDKEVRVGGGLARLSPVRHGPGFLDQVLYPVEKPLPKSSGLHSVSVHYDGRDFSLFGWHLPWIVIFFIFVMGFALALKSRLHVTF
jgi:hypothetical protein